LPEQWLGLRVLAAVPVLHGAAVQAAERFALGRVTSRW
jgi:hypothetical protein